MGYSQYGGYGYRNADRVDAASDAVVTPDMKNVGTSGTWPGFGAAVDEMGAEAFHALRARSVDGHVVIGDGPVLVSLLKQSISVYLLADGTFHDLNLQTIGVDLPDEVLIDFGDGTCMLDADRLVECTETLRFEIEGHVIEYRMIAHPQWVQHARITQPDGTVWTAFCGSEIGAGHDDDDTRPIAEKHLRIFGPAA